MRFDRFVLCLTLLLLALPVQAQAQAQPRSQYEQQSTLIAAKRKRKRRKKRRKKRRRWKKKARSKKRIAAPKPKPVVEAAKPEPVVAAPEPEAEKPGVAVLDMAVVEGVSDGVAQIVNELLVTRLSKAQVFGSVIGSSDIAQMVSLEQQKTMLGCEEESCIAQLGGALGVPLMIVPAMGKLGNEYVMTLKITDVDAAQVKVRQSITVPDEPAMAKGMEWLVDASLAEFSGQALPPMPTLERTVPLAVAGGSGRMKTVLVIGSGVVGAGLAGLGYVHAEPARTTFDQRQDVDSLRSLESAVASGNVMVGLGYTMVAGAILWGLL